MSYPYAVYVTYGQRTEKYAETKELSAAEAVFAAVPHSFGAVIELRYLAPISTKWEVLARKGNVVKGKTHA